MMVVLYISMNTTVSSLSSFVIETDLKLILVIVYWSLGELKLLACFD